MRFKKRGLNLIPRHTTAKNNPGKLEIAYGLATAVRGLWELETPPNPAALTTFWRCGGLMPFSEVLILLSPPDLLQWPLKYVAENYGRIVYRRKWRDAAGKSISLGSDVNNLPGTEAPSPGRSIRGAPSDAVHWVGET